MSLEPQRQTAAGGQPAIALTIGIFTYNRSALLAKALGEFQRQIAALGVTDVEVVVSDNASPDNTESVARSFADKFPNFQYHRQASNIGAIRNYLAVVRLARGRYVWPFSDDDIPAEGMVAHIRELVLRGGEKFILGNFSRFSTSTGQVVLDRTLSLTEDRRFPSIIDVAIYVGLFETITLVSVAIFERDRFLAVDPEPYLARDTWFAHVYVLLEAFAGKACLLLARPIALHNVDEARWRDQWREVSGRGHLYLHTIGTLRGIRTLRERGIVPPTFLVDVQEPEITSWSPRIEVVRPTAMIVLRRLASFSLGEMQEGRHVAGDEWLLANEEFALLQRPDLMLLLRQIHLASERLRVLQEICSADVAVLQQYARL